MNSGRKARNRHKMVSINCREALSVPDPHSPVGEIDMEDDSFHTRLVKEIIAKQLRKLSEKEARVVKLYFGLDPHSQPMMLDEVAEVMGFSLKYVRLLRDRALFKIRKDPQSVWLAEIWWEFTS